MAGLKAMATKGLKLENAFDDVHPPGCPGVVPEDEREPMLAWRVNENLKRIYDMKLLRGGPGQAGKKRCVDGVMIVEKMLEELKVQDAAYKSLVDELPDKMSLTNEQMKFVEKNHPGLLGKLVAVSGEVAVSDVPLEGHCSVGMK